MQAIVRWVYMVMYIAKQVSAHLQHASQAFAPRTGVCMPFGKPVTKPEGNASTNSGEVGMLGRLLEGLFESHIHLLIDLLDSRKLDPSSETKIRYSQRLGMYSCNSRAG